MTQSRHFPMTLAAGVTVRPLTPADSTRLKDTVLPRIFPGIEDLHYRAPAARQPGLAALREDFARPGAIELGFYHRDRPIGWYYGYMEEAHTHHIDTVGLLPDLQGQGVYTSFLPPLLAYLTALGFERVTVFHQPNNPAVIIPELRAGFVIVGMVLHEELGPLVKMARFLHDDRRRAFEDAFSIPPQNNNR